MHKLLMSAVSTAAISLCVGQAWADGPVGPPPAAAFAPPAISDASISPDGKHLILLGVADKSMVANIIGIDDQKVSTLAFADDVFNAEWGSNDYALVSATMKQVFRDDPHRVYRYTRDYLIRTDGRLVGQVLNDSAASAASTGLPILAYIDDPQPALIVKGLDVSPQAIQMQADDTRIKSKQSDLVFALYRVDPATGHGRMIERGNQNTIDWLVDAQGQPRVRWDVDARHALVVSGRAKGAGNFKTLYEMPAGREPPDIQGYSDPDDAVLVAVTHDGKAQIVRKNLHDGTETVIGPKAAWDSASVRWDVRTKTPVEIVSGEGDVEWLDAGLGATQSTLAKAFKGKDVALEAWSKDRSRIVAKVEAGDAPPVWYLYDSARHEVSPIQEAYPGLKGAALGTKSFFTYKASDGLGIPAYLTLPPGAPASGGKLPLVVLPHGGPSAHDDAGFDELAQFIATRGYAVLQPQFRGSTGFGAALEKAGRKEWGGKMQSDLLDGIKALADKGVIDPSRVCIVGWSYGGYAALTGAVQAPKAFRCVVSINGVTDLLIMTGDEVRNFGQASDSTYDLKQEIGDPATEGAHMDAISPAKNADRIEAPVLLVGGEDDTTVPFKHTQAMFQALHDAGKDVKLVSFKGDDHYLFSKSDRIAMLQELEAFLAKNLPVK